MQDEKLARFVVASHIRHHPNANDGEGEAPPVSSAAGALYYLALKNTLSFTLGLGIGCNFMIDNQLQPTDHR